MLITIVGIAQTKAFMLNLTAPAPRNDTNAVSQQYPLLGNLRCLHYGADDRHKSDNAHGHSWLPSDCTSSVPLPGGGVWRPPRWLWGGAFPPLIVLSSLAMCIFR